MNPQVGRENAEESRIGGGRSGHLRAPGYPKAATRFPNAELPDTGARPKRPEGGRHVRRGRILMEKRGYGCIASLTAAIASLHTLPMRQRLGHLVSTWALCLVGASHAGAWTAQLTGSEANGSPSFTEAANAVVVDAAGDVYSAGTLENRDTGHDIVVVKSDGTTGSESWRQVIDGASEAPDADAINDLAIDATGGVYAVGQLAVEGDEPDFAVFKFSATTGDELWRRTLAGSSSGGAATSAVLDGDENLIAVGLASVPFSSTRFCVVKYAPNGDQSWIRLINGTNPAGGAAAYDVAVDGAGDIIAVGSLWNGGTLGDFTVLKLDGGTGAELWRRELHFATYDLARAVTVDASGDILVAGTRSIGGFARLLVVKFDGATGAEVWQHEISNGQNAPSFTRPDVSVDASGAVIAVGVLHSTDRNDVVAVKIDGATGAEIWLQILASTSSFVTTVGWPPRVRLDTAGDAYVSAGTLVAEDALGEFAVFKLQSADGMEAWRQQFDGNDTGFDRARSLAIDPAGWVVAAGELDDARKNGISDFAVVKLRASDGTVGAVPGQSLLLRDPGDPGRRRLRVHLRGASIRSPVVGTPADPTLNGATIRLWNPTTLEAVELALPSGAAWKGLGKPPGAKGFKFSSKSAPCRSVVVRKGGSLRLSCGSPASLLPFSLDEPAQGTIALSVQFGTSAPQCAVFGGLIVADEPSIFRAKKAAGSPACP